MVKSRANRILESGIWRYLDQADAAFVCISAWSGCPIEYVDDFIDNAALKDETIRHLLALRHDALQAYIKKDFPLMDAHLNALHLACSYVGISDHAKMGVSFRKTQSAKGTASAAARWSGEDRGTLDAIVEQLSKERDALGDYVRPADLWPQLLGKLDTLGAAPVESGGRNQLKASVTYGNAREEYTYESFRKQIGRLRNGGT